MSTVSTPAPTLISSIRTPLSTPKPTMVHIHASRSTSVFALGNVIDDQLVESIYSYRSSISLPRIRCYHTERQPFTFVFFSHPFFYSQNGLNSQIGCLYQGDNIPWFPDFLDSQAGFDYILGNTPVILRVTRRATGSYATEETEYLATQINKYCDLFQLHLFCSIIKL